MTTQHQDPSICCPEFYPTPWQDKLFRWENKKFIRDKVFTVFYMPLTFSKVMKKLDETISKAEAAIPDYLCLSDHTSQWNMDLYLAVDKEIPGPENTTISGKFFSKVYEGPFRDTGKWMKEFDATVKSNGLASKKVYMWYTTCPKCAKKYGNNYVVILAQVE